jgi:DNA-directed RNA polymerase specialized sigma24 family protein
MFILPEKSYDKKCRGWVSEKQRTLENYSKEVIVTGILERDNDVARWLYLRVYHYLEAFISRRNGTAIEALDVFHEGMLILLERLHEAAVPVKRNIPEYLFGICRYLWYRYYHENTRFRGISVDDLDAFVSSVEENFPVFSEQRELRYILYLRHLPSLDMKCRRLLEMYLSNRDTEAIREELSYRNLNSVYKKKYGCLRKLVTLIRSDPDYASL